MDLYRENLLDHYKNPRYFGKPETGASLVSEEINPSCGDSIGVAVKINRQQEISEIHFWGEGCIVSIAATSMLIEKVKAQKKLSKVLSLTQKDVFKLLGGKEAVPPARFTCALMGFEALKKVLSKVAAEKVKR
ncbi:MAG: SUF system FeS assembly protein, NifU family [Microgenomates group bacterium GW2011_GWA2_44_7]|nr:MAG: SUF system FeS assembly protein, NifU family [Microgenomates group bacterium GW2011_GWA2_44_7]KKT77836.1 MAG: SUF system FeS assembly protein, NifU family [Microgenomates group bacterium GW2011_GWB1_44_8]